MKTGIVKLLIAGLIGYSATSVAMKATASPAPARQVAPQRAGWAPVGAQTRRPIGWHNLCQVQPDECQAGAQRPVNVELTPEARRLLASVTVLANKVIAAKTDDEHFHLDRKTLIDWWTYPD